MEAAAATNATTPPNAAINSCRRIDPADPTSSCARREFQIGQQDLALGLRAQEQRDHEADQTAHGSDQHGNREPHVPFDGEVGQDRWYKTPGGGAQWKQNAAAVALISVGKRSLA
jgi:hypothetical protein